MSKGDHPWLDEEGNKSQSEALLDGRKNSGVSHFVLSQVLAELEGWIGSPASSQRRPAAERLPWHRRCDMPGSPGEPLTTTHAALAFGAQLTPLPNPALRVIQVREVSLRLGGRMAHANWAFRQVFGDRDSTEEPADGPHRLPRPPRASPSPSLSCREPTGKLPLACTQRT
jgi:hypothetical protein